ncbi:MAG: AAA family ATPase [Candidatus Promineifilaceae bacterium]
MPEIFITEIDVQSTPRVPKLKIPISDSERKHLIITGKNGSGKTTLLLAINNFLEKLVNGTYGNYSRNLLALESNQRRQDKLQKTQPPDHARIAQATNNIENFEKYFSSFDGLKLQFIQNELLTTGVLKPNLLVAYFDAKRQTNLNTPRGINKFDFKEQYKPQEKSNQDFIQYIVNLKAERSFARDDGDMQVVQEIDQWFSRFEGQLQTLFNSPDLKLVFDRKNFNFTIQQRDSVGFDLNQLSDGYSAALSIVTELIMRMEAHGNRAYDWQGIVLIDEIETHLHVDLQKKILPFLIDFFPNIQFIVTTHSPFVLSSISNAVICDLETKLITTDLSGYSYDALIESYFDVDKYSEMVKGQIERYERLSSQNERSDHEQDAWLQLRTTLRELPKFYAPELVAKLQQIELKNRLRQRSS